MRYGKFVWKRRTGSKGPYWFFSLVATNGRIIATSETYMSKAAMFNGIASIRKTAPIARVVEAKRSSRIGP